MPTPDDLHITITTHTSPPPVLVNIWGGDGLGNWWEIDPSELVTMCDCKFDPDPDDPDENTPETAWHFRRTCKACGNVWYGLHCPHDGAQNPCPACGVVPEFVPDI